MFRAHKCLSKHKCNSSSQELHIPPGFRGTYKRWTDVGLSKALKDIDKGLSFRKCMVFQGQLCMIMCLEKLHTVCGAKCGPDPYLDLEEEEELAIFLIRSAEVGYPHTKKQTFALVSLVQQMLDKKGIEANVTNGWWERFKNCHRNVTTCVAVPLSVARAKVGNPVVLKGYMLILICLKSA